MPKILIATGGTGGHLLPAQKLAEQLPAQVLFAGHKLATSPYFDRARFAFAEIVSSPSLRKPISLFKGIWQALRLIRKEKPDVVVGFGSFHSAPILVAAVLLRKKIVLYEANQSMGKVNRWIAPFAKAIGCQFPLPNCVPVTLHKQEVSYTKAEARKQYGIDPDRFTLLVFGGSQGAAFLNEIMPQVLPQLPHVQVIHFTGASTVQYGITAVVKPFETNMALAYSAADFVVCRSGAGTIAELIRYAKPALLIPYPFAAEGHQQKNGEYLRALGGCVVLDQAEATAQAIVANIQQANLEAMQLALRSAFRQNPISLTQLVMQYAK